MIVFDDTVIAVFFLGWGGGDVMSALKLVEGGEGTEISLRIRYYDEDDPNNQPFSGKDDKRWFQAVSKHNKEQAVASMRTVFDSMEETLQRTQMSTRPHERTELIRGEDEEWEQFLIRFSLQSWVHTKKDE